MAKKTKNIRPIQTIASYAFFIFFGVGLLYLGYQQIYLSCSRSANNSVSCSITEKYFLNLKVKQREIQGVTAVEFQTHSVARDQGSTEIPVSRLILTNKNEQVPLTSSSSNYRDLVNTLIKRDLNRYLKSDEVNYSLYIDDRQWFGYVGMGLLFIIITSLPYLIADIIKSKRQKT